MSINLHNNMRWILLKVTRFWKRTLPQGLFGRSMLILITPLVLTLGIGLFVFFDRHWSTTTTRLANSLAGEIVLVTEAWEREDTILDQTRLIALARDNLELKVRFQPHAKIPVTQPLDVPGLKILLKRSLQEKLDRPFAITPYGHDHDWVLISIPVKNGILDFRVAQKRLFSTTTYVFLLIMLGSGLFLSVIAVIFMRNQIRPIRILAQNAEKFGKGIDIRAFKPAGAREIRQAAHAFLEMRDRIQRQIRQRTDMLSGVSHDLRTPLTRLKLQLAMLPQNHETEAMQSDINAMEKMIAAYLEFARSETLEIPVRCDIKTLLQTAIHDATRQGLEVEANMPGGPLIAILRPQGLQRVFANILENARLYAGKTWVSLAALPRNAEIIFDDNGPGIDPHNRDDVFKPFHRLDMSRNQDIEGTGLGLTIARDLIQSHGGTIALDSSPYGGLRIVIYLPL